MNVDNLSAYERFQYEKYGDILPERFAVVPADPDKDGAEIDQEAMDKWISDQAEYSITEQSF